MDTKKWSATNLSFICRSCSFKDMSGVNWWTVVSQVLKPKSPGGALFTGYPWQGWTTYDNSSSRMQETDGWNSGIYTSFKKFSSYAASTLAKIQDKQNCSFKRNMERKTITISPRCQMHGNCGARIFYSAVVNPGCSFLYQPILPGILMCKTS